MSQFIRYRHNSSASAGRWEYAEVREGEDLDEYKHDLIAGCSWAELDGYRGCEVEKIEHPPLEWLQAEVTEAALAVVRYQARMLRYVNLMKEIQDAEGR